MELNEMQRSALQEAGNIGSGHAAIALSQLMGRRIMIAIPSIQLFELEELENIVNGKNKIFVQISFSVLGDVRGAIIFVLEKSMALKLCDVVMGQEAEKTKLVSELEQSALKEVGSILSASYLNALSEMTKLSLIISVPEYSIGDAKLIDKILVHKDLDPVKIKEGLCIKTEFIEFANRMEGYLIFVPTQDAIEKILNRLKV